MELVSFESPVGYVSRGLKYGVHSGNRLHRLCHLSLDVQGSHQYEAVYKPSEYHVSRFMDFYVPAA